jgi:hypothetical protein
MVGRRQALAALLPLLTRTPVLTNPALMTSCNLDYVHKGPASKESYWGLELQHMDLDRYNSVHNAL